MTPPQSLSKVGYYRILRLLGEGGMGAVYEARHQMTRRRVAVKTLRAELTDRRDLDARFFNEARTISFLDHPGIVRVHDVGRTPDGTAYMVMELCRGPSLGAALSKETRLPVRLGFLASVADALTYAHAQGVVHRDLKPDNVLVTPSDQGPRVRVLDFGIAKVLDGTLAAGSPFAVKTREGSAMGTPMYMSPEQCRGVGGITQATDVYALGIMLYETVTGAVPFKGGVGEIILQHLTTIPPALGDLPDAPGIGALIASMLQKEAKDRPAMAEVASALTVYAPEQRHFVFPPLEAFTRAEPAPAGSTAANDPTLPAPAQMPAPSVPPVVITGNRHVTIKRRAPLYAGVAIIVAVIGGALWLRPASKHPVTPTATPKATHETTAPTPSAPRPAAAPGWLIESTPSGADVFLPDGTLLGTTPYRADAVLSRGLHTVYVRKVGWRDEIVRYDSRPVSPVRLSNRAAPHVGMNRTETKPLAAPRPPPLKPKDDFEIKPLH